MTTPRDPTQRPNLAGASAVDPAPDLVPRWLAALVLALLLAVVLVGGFLLRGFFTHGKAPSTTQQVETQNWTERVATNPSDTKARLGLGYAYQSEGLFDKALEQYDSVLKSEPTNLAALYNQGNVYFKLGLNDKAVKSMWKVLDIDSTHMLAAKTLGEYYAGKGQYKSLIATVKPAVDAHPELADLQCLLGKAYEKVGNPPAAARCYQLAVKYAPDLSAAQQGLKRVAASN